MKDLSGKKFGRLIVIRDSGERCNGHIMWMCKCIGSNERPHPEKFKNIKTGSLTSGTTKSCGCLNIENITKHGMAHTTEYKSYESAKRRCNNKYSHNYENYGGRGIKFLFETFNDFYRELGPKPTIKHTVDRIDNDGNYEPGNVKWATTEEQNQKQRNTKLFPDAIRYIRLNMGIDNEILALRYGVSIRTIEQVKNYERWKNIKIEGEKYE